MKAAFVILHSAWLMVMLLMTPAAMAFSSNKDALRGELMVSFVFVVSGCASVILSRRRTAALLVAIPYFFGLQDLLRKMFEELRFVQNRGSDAGGTWVTILLILGSLILWSLCIFRQTAAKGTASPGSR